MQSLDELRARIAALQSGNFSNLIAPAAPTSLNPNTSAQSSTGTDVGATQNSRPWSTAAGAGQTPIFTASAAPGSTPTASSIPNSLRQSLLNSNADEGIDRSKLPEWTSVIPQGRVRFAITNLFKYRPDMPVPEAFRDIIGAGGDAYTQSGQASTSARNDILTNNPGMQNALQHLKPKLFSAPATYPGANYLSVGNSKLTYENSDYITTGAATGTQSKYNDPANTQNPKPLAQAGEVKEVDGKLVIPADRMLLYFNGWKDYNHGNSDEVLASLSPRGQDLLKLAVIDSQLPFSEIDGNSIVNKEQREQEREVLVMRLKTSDRIQEVSNTFSLKIPEGSYPIFVSGSSGHDTGYDEYAPNPMKQIGMSWDHGQQTMDATYARKQGQPWPQFMIGYIGADGTEHRFEDGSALMIDKKGNINKLTQEEYAIAHGGNPISLGQSPFDLTNQRFSDWHLHPWTTHLVVDSPGTSVNGWPADMDIERLRAAHKYLHDQLKLPEGTVAIFQQGSRTNLIGYETPTGRTYFDAPVKLDVGKALTPEQIEELRKSVMNPANADANLFNLAN